MRLFSMVFFTGLFLVIGCSKSPTAQAGACNSSTLLGTYQSTSTNQADTLVFNTDCTATSSYCQSQFTYTPATGTSGVVTINATATDANAGCPVNGSGSCSYSISGNTLQWGCGQDSNSISTVISYTK